MKRLSALWPDTLFTRIFLLIGSILLVSQAAIYWYFILNPDNPPAHRLAQNWAQILALGTQLHAGDTVPLHNASAIEVRPASGIQGVPPRNPLYRSALHVLRGMGWPEAGLAEDRQQKILWLLASPRGGIAIGIPPPYPSSPFPPWARLGVIVMLSLIGAFLTVRQLTLPLSRLIAGVMAARETERPAVLPVSGPADLRRLAVHLNNALRDLHELWKEREMVLLGVSHDLRTPLTRMRMLTEFLPQEDATIRTDMIANLREMDQIIHQFLDYARSGSGEDGVTLDLGVWLKAFVEKQGPGTSLDLPSSPAIFLKTGPVSLGRILQNLIDNAQRHGAPPILVSLAREEGGVLISVRDAGPGIDPGVIGRLGTPFAFTGQGGGTGLGLAIIQRILRRLGGKISFHNLPDRGLEARVFLPYPEGTARGKT